MMRIAITGAAGCWAAPSWKWRWRRGHSVVSIDRVAAGQAGPSGRGLASLQVEMADYDASSGPARLRRADPHGGHPRAGRHPDHVVHNNNVVGSYNALQRRGRAGHQAGLPGLERQCHRQVLSAASRATTISRSTSGIPPTTKTLQPIEVDLRAAGRFLCPALRVHDHRQPALSRRRERPCRAQMATGTAKRRRSKHLWGYTLFERAGARLLLCADSRFQGPRGFYIVAPNTVAGRAFARAEAAFLSRSARTRRS